MKFDSVIYALAFLALALISWPSKEAAADIAPPADMIVQSDLTIPADSKIAGNNDAEPDELSEEADAERIATAER